MSESFQRKQDHIDLCNEGDVGFKSHQGLFDDVTLIHNALPELAMSEIELTTRLLDSQLSVPVMLTGMTGGPERAGMINRDLAQLCEKMGIAFGVGSQRVLLKAPEALKTFDVRRYAPNLVLFGNIGVNQARTHGVDTVRELMERIEANYLAIHLNPAMELAQPGAEADSDFRDGYETIARLVDAFEGRILVKECGTGLSPTLVRRLESLGVRSVDVSGSGGTSWVKVEALRAQGALASLGETFAEWGIPTVAATAMARAVSKNLTIVASGGVDNGLKAGIALAMGADIVGMARPVLQAYLSGGVDAAQDWLETLIAGIRTTLALTGSRNVDELRRAPRILGPNLKSWLEKPIRTPEPIDHSRILFADFFVQDDSVIQGVIRRLTMDDLAYALKGCTESEAGRVFDNLASEDSHSLRAQIGALGRVSVREVLARRDKIRATLGCMQASLNMSLAHKEDEFVE